MVIVTINLFPVFFSVKTVIGVGEGAGANIICRFGVRRFLEIFIWFFISSILDGASESSLGYYLNSLHVDYGWRFRIHQRQGEHWFSIFSIFYDHLLSRLSIGNLAPKEWINPHGIILRSINSARYVTFLEFSLRPYVTVFWFLMSACHIAM